MEYLIGERNLSHNTQQSYRDTLTLLLPFTGRQQKKTVDLLAVEDLSSQVLRDFLDHLEKQRGCSIRTRNQRLAAVHAMARFIAERSPEHIEWAGEIRIVPFKRFDLPALSYLEKAEIDAILAAPNCSSRQGHRDHILLLFLYNSGARVSEAAGLKIADLDLHSNTMSIVKLLGKGRKTRRCPLWEATAKGLSALIRDRPPDQPVFLNRLGQPLTRHGIHEMLRKHVRKASASQLSRTRQPRPHGSASVSKSNCLMLIRQLQSSASPCTCDERSVTMRQESMNIVGFSASPRPQGSTAWVVNTILEGARHQGAKVCFWNAASLDLQPCRACFSCRTRDHRCLIQDDMPRVHASILEAQALVLGMPIFMGQMSAQAKIFVDRMHPFFAPRFSPSFQEGNAGKALILVFIQGNPDHELFRIYIDYTSQIFRTLEFDVREIVVVTGTRSVTAQEQDDLYARLKMIGASLASEQEERRA